ncbi:MAG: cell division FtsK/SpoIIIE [Parcubacteria group bacterium GW2011_GWB1_40_14]|nr:MAG: cell division FtsK/SpoIIIE [Parcubacteria group bacterium GW2011_GWB1_40_14]
MSNKRGKNRINEDRLDKRIRRTKKVKLDLHPVTKKWIAGVLFVGLAIIMFLGFLNSAGPIGRFITTNSSKLFGWTAPIFPVIFLLIGIVLFRTRERTVWASNLLGSTFFLLGLSAILNIVGQDGTQRGGSIGYWVSFLPIRGFGTIASVIFFASIVIVGLLMLFNYPASLGEHAEEDEETEEGTNKFKFMLGLIISPFLRLKKNVASLPRPALPQDFGGASTPSFKVHKLEDEPLGGLNEKKEGSAVFGGEKELVLRPIKLSVPYQMPPLSLLDEDKGKPTSGDIKATMHIIKRTLSNFGIEVEMGEVSVGPTVTQYTLKPAEGIKLSRITALYNDLSLALAAHPIRIEAPIPGRSLVGIEVPNHAITLVRLRNLLESEQFQGSQYRLNFAIGRDVAGNPVFAAIEKMPHLLIAGATGTGKTIALNSLLMSLLYRNPPSMMKLLLVDPKRVEFPVYNGIPHLLAPVIVDAQKTINALRWAVREMERRFDILAADKSRDIGLYNRELKRGQDPLPYIVIVIDELADLMAARGKEVEAVIVRLAQMARAVGIHLVVATQRPSVEVITGLIKANITSRLAFQVASQIDSRTIIDNQGAEKLLGNGDMLFMSAESTKPKRIQGSYISEKEVKRVVDFLKKNSEPEYNNSVIEPVQDSGNEFRDSGEDSFGDEDPLYEEAKHLVIQAKKASASYLQRRLRIGYARAARLLDILEERGVIGPGDGAKPREILIGGLPVQVDENEVDEDGYIGRMSI